MRALRAVYRDADHVAASDMYLSVALICCKLRYAVVVCDYVWAHPAHWRSITCQTHCRIVSCNMYTRALLFAVRINSCSEELARQGLRGKKARIGTCPKQGHCLLLQPPPSLHGH